MSGAICCPAPISTRVRIIWCPFCARRRKMLVDSFEWYGPRVVCLACGQTWNDGEPGPRGVKARAESKARARK